MSNAPSSSHTFQPESADALREFVANNSQAEKKTLTVGTAATPSETTVDVDLSRLNQLIDYPAADMTVTVEAGMPVGTLNNTLAEQGQQLPIDVPGDDVTIGALVATNCSGSRRFGYGTLRDYVIGISAIDGQGRAFQSGGRVVKNVAGYDLCKLLIGSHGTLAIITHVTLKVRPRPATVAGVWCRCPDTATLDAALETLTTSAARPVVVDALDEHAATRYQPPSLEDGSGPALVVIADGTKAETTWQTETLASELADHTTQLQPIDGKATRSLLQCLTHHVRGAVDGLRFHITTCPSETPRLLELLAARRIAAVAHAGNGFITGHLADESLTAEEVSTLLAPLRAVLRESDGALAVDRAPTQAVSIDWFGPRPPAWPLMCEIKQALDPEGVLSSGGPFDQFLLDPSTSGAT